MRRFARRGWEVLFVEGIPMRGVSAADRAELRRVVAKVRARAGTRLVDERLRVVRPLPIPPAGRIGRGVQLAALRAQLRSVIRRAGLDGASAVSWFSVPVA